MMGALLLGFSILLQAQAGPPRDVEASPGTGSISGRVIAADTGQPLPRMPVTLARPGGAPEHETLTGADGRYQFTGVPDGPYVVTAGPAEHRSTYFPGRFGEQAPATPFDAALRPGLSLAPGQARTDVDITLSRALAVSGRVFDPWDEPMANVDVVVMRAEGGPAYAPPAPTDDLGAYRVYGLTPGRYRVCAAVRDRAQDLPADVALFVRTCHPGSVVERESGDVVLYASDVAGIDIRVQRLGTFTISGIVVDAGGAAVTGAGPRSTSSRETSGLSISR